MKITKTNDPNKDALIKENNSLQEKLNRAEKALEGCLKNSSNKIEIEKIASSALAVIKKLSN